MLLGTDSDAWMKRALWTVSLVVITVLVASCGSGSAAGDRYLVPKGDPRVLDHTYDRMLRELERRRADDPGDVLDGATAGQRMLYLLFFVDDEIANGGLYQAESPWGLCRRSNSRRGFDRR